MSKWMERHYARYDADEAPAVLMPAPNHRRTFGVYNRWRAKMAKRMGGRFDWKKVTLSDIKRLAEDMFDAAGVPADVRAVYWSEFEKMLRTLRE